MQYFDFKGAVQVWSGNLEEEFQKFSEVSFAHNLIYVSVEFPGIINVPLEIPDSPSSLRNIIPLALSVNSMKMIQVSFAASNTEGNANRKAKTWTFNMQYNVFDGSEPKDVNIIQYMQEKLNVDFYAHLEDGIKYEEFSELFCFHKLLANPQIHWVSCNGSYSLAYLLKHVEGFVIPTSLMQFQAMIDLYFPNYLDIALLVSHEKVEEKYPLVAEPEPNSIEEIGFVKLEVIASYDLSSMKVLVMRKVYQRLESIVPLEELKRNNRKLPWLKCLDHGQ